MNKQNELVKVEVEANEAEVQSAKELLKETRKAKAMEILTKVKKGAIEAAKYSVPAVVTAVVMKAKYESKETVTEEVDAEFVEIPADEEVVLEDTGE